MIDPIIWQGDLAQGHVVLIDQTALPCQKEMLAITTSEQMWDAIRRLKVRGAPAIGIAAAYGVVLSIRAARTIAELDEQLKDAVRYLGTARPTAVNLFWALRRMQSTFEQQIGCGNINEIKQRLWQEAEMILQEDRRTCQAIGQIGATLVADGARLLTHCNAGGLATSGYGTALAIFFSAHQSGKNIHVYVDETRPLWQGARLTAWELQQASIPMTLICDNTAAFLMQQNKIDMIFVGADRIAANGDTANKIGTYNLAILAHVHEVPFYVVAPISTFDLSIASGSEIEIEERGAEEITMPYGQKIAPENTTVYAPAFDITPACYLSGIITERGIVDAPVEYSKIKEIL